MSNHLAHWGNAVALELDRVVCFVFAIVLLVVVAVYVISLFYVLVTRNGTCTFRDGLKRSEQSKNKQQLIAELKNKITTRHLWQQ